MNITLIGSGGWDGIPSAFCRCSICKAATNEPISKNSRTRPLLKISTANTNFCIDIGPDFRSQSSRFDLEVDTFFVSHWHYDHLFGIFELGAWFGLKLNKKPIIYCSQGTANYIHEHMGFMDLDIRILKAYDHIEIDGVTITTIPMYHMRSIDDNKNVGDLDTFGFIIEENEVKVAYLADYYKLPDTTMDLVKSCAISIADGTYLLEHLYPNDDLRNAFKQYADPDHLHGTDIFNFAESLGGMPVVYHSITHLPELTHDAMQNLLPKKHYIGYDGMSITELI